jgi:hypothetical protein
MGTYMFGTYSLVPYMYVKLCRADDVLCAYWYRHFVKCTACIKLCTYSDVLFWAHLFVLPGWLACKQGLAAARCHTYSSTLV